MQSRCWLELQSSEGLTGAGAGAGGLFPGCLTHSACRVLRAAVRRPQLSPCGPLPRLLECPHSMAAGFPQDQVSQEEEQWNSQSFIILPRKLYTVITTMFHWSHRAAWYNVGGDHTKVWMTHHFESWLLHKRRERREKRRNLVKCLTKNLVFKRWLWLETLDKIQVKIANCRGKLGLAVLLDNPTPYPAAV